MINKYFKRLDNKYLVSGPAPLGRILNYIKRIKLGKYRTSIRGPRITDTRNLDDWTICFMVGLGLIKEPVYRPNLKLALTKNGEKVYQKIKDLPKFPDDLFKAKTDMRIIKSELILQNPSLYNLLRDIFLKSASMRNFALFLRNKDKKKIEKVKFKEYGKIFGVTRAWFNRVPSTWQIAEFCGIIEENKGYIRAYDIDYIDNFSILNTKEVTQKTIEEDLEERKPKLRRLDEEEKFFLEDISLHAVPQRKETILNLIQRNSRITKKLKKLYNGRCQICGFTFKKEDGENYSEANHLIPLGENGSDSIHNLTILCANCHREMTYADVKLGKIGSNNRIIVINGIKREIKYHPIHFKAIKESDIKV